MIIYLVRHGVTEDNTAQVFQGPNSQLSPEGEVQAGKVAERLSGIKIDEIWTSPMSRAKRTAEIINEYQKTVLSEVPELQEIRRPKAVIGKTMAQIVAEGHKYSGVGMWTNPRMKYDGSESFAELVVRAQATITRLEEKAKYEPPDFTLLITSHGVMLGTLLLCFLLDKHAKPKVVLDAFRKTKMENTGISIARIDKDGRRSLLTMGDFAHL